MMGRLFGTNGVRGIVNETMTADLAIRLGRAYGTYVRRAAEHGPVFVGMDVRTSSPMLASAVAAGLVATGVDVALVGPCPTPALQVAVQDRGAAGAVMVTASHNPPEFNGLKIVEPDGREASRDTEAEIEDIYFSERFESAGWDQLGRITEIDGVNAAYVDRIVSKVAQAEIEKRRPTVVLDCGNGAGCYAAPKILARLGARVVLLNGEPDGRFPGRPSEPTPENLGALVAAVRSERADLGVAQDGDADRVVFVDEAGRFVPGDVSLALLSARMLERHPGGTVVTPVTTSSCVADVVKAKGGKLVTTAVGSPVIGDRMKKIGGVVGGEENGGVLFADHLLARDGAMAAARILELVVERAAPLSKLVGEIPRYHVQKLKVKCPDDRKTRVMQGVAAAHAGRPTDTTDGVKVFFSDGWVIVRPSGTEPLVRVFAEAREEAAARRIAEEQAKLVESLVRGP
ncbi:MAG: phosphoglucosamine mutase [Methanobacteriota archaeon]